MKVPLMVEEQEQIRNEILVRCNLVGDCWVYTGQINSSGYGIKKIRGVHRTVSRFMLAYDTRQMSGLEKTPEFPFDACHKDELCPYRACCNPDHLYWGKRSPNSTDRELKEKQQRDLFSFWETHAWIEGKFYNDRPDPSIGSCLASINEGRKLPNGTPPLQGCYGAVSAVQSYPDSEECLDPQTWDKTLSFFSSLANRDSVAA